MVALHLGDAFLNSRMLITQANGCALDFKFQPR
jgi:hypothetical protein